jgi:hypothetical protein
MAGRTSTSRFKVMWGIWQCPKCGGIGRLRHRYDAGLPPTEHPLTNADVGPCVGQLLLFPKD